MATKSDQEYQKARDKALFYLTFTATIASAAFVSLLRIIFQKDPSEWFVSVGSMFITLILLIILWRKAVTTWQWVRRFSQAVTLARYELREVLGGCLIGCLMALVWNPQLPSILPLTPGSAWAFGLILTTILALLIAMTVSWYLEAKAE